MAETVAVLVARLEADVRKFEKGMRTAEKRLDKLDKNTQTNTKSQKGLTGQMGATGAMMKTVFAGAAAGAVLKFGKDALQASVDLNEALNASEVVFGEYAGGIQEIGRRSAESFGLSESSFLQFATRFSAFAKNIAGDAGSVVDVTEELTTRVADFASVHNLEVEEAAVVVQSALAGETEAFRRFGGDVSAAAVNVKGLSLGLGDASGKLTEQEKILARYELVMEQTAVTAGDFANTSDDVANKQKIVAARMEDAKAKIGQGLQPVMLALLEVTEDLIPTFVTFGEGLSDTVGHLTPVISGLGELLRLMEEIPGAAEDIPILGTGPGGFLGFLRGGPFAGAGAALEGLFGESDTEALLQTTAELDKLEEAFMGVDSAIRGQFAQSVADAEASVGSADKKFKQFGDTIGEQTKAEQELAKYTEGGFTAGLHAGETAIDKYRRAVERAADELEELQDEQLAVIDVGFRAIRALGDWEEALDEAAEAEAEFGEGSDEANEANMRVLETYGELIGAARQFASQEGVGFEQAMRQIGAEAGLSADAIQFIIDNANELDSLNPTVSIEVLGDVSGWWAEQQRLLALNPLTLQVIPYSTAKPPNTTVSPTNPFEGEFGLPHRAHGGPVVSGRPYTVGEQGPELFVPRQSGSIVPNGGNGTPILIQLTVDGNVLAEQLVTSEELNRRRGLG